MKVRAHTVYLGRTGYASHARGFFRELSKHVDLRVRNYAWDSYENIKTYINDADISILDKITLSTQTGYQDFNPSYSSELSSWKFKDDKFDQDIDIVLVEPGHPYFYQNYSAKIKIAYIVWESTKIQDDFIELLKSKFDYVWVVSSWHKECLSKQYPIDKIYIVPEGIDSDFNVNNIFEKLEEYNDNKFKFLFFGRWDYRKSVPEILNAFLDEFDDEDIDLILSVDNVFANDGFSSTEERLKSYNIEDKRIKIKHFPSREEYVNYLHNGNVFITCARSEGWNIPLSEAIAAGTPVIYSNWGAQLEFCEGIGNPVNIICEEQAPNIPGNYCKPDYDDLKKVMRYTYENYNSEKLKSEQYSKSIIDKFSWEKIGEIGFKTLKLILEDNNEIGIVFSDQISDLIKYKNRKIPTLLIGDSIDYDSNFIIYDKKSNREELINISIDFAKNSGYKKIIFDNYIKIDLDKDNESIIKNYLNIKSEIKINILFIEGAKVEIFSNESKEYKVSFIDFSNNKILYQTNIFNNCWCSCNIKYFIDWFIRIEDLNGDIIHEERINLENKKVFICVESSSLGDSIAWMPHIEEFRKKHNCEVVLSGFKNDLFESEYPNINFISPGSIVNNLYALYRIGWYYYNGIVDTNRNPVDPKTRPMQATTTDILGLEYTQIRTKIYIPDKKPSIDGDYVCIAVHATAQSKYWNNPTGWQDLINYFNSINYKVVLISKESVEYMGNKQLENIIDKTGDISLEDRINDIKHAKMYIGIGSGLSWLAWAIGTPVTLISGFSTPQTEFLGDDVIRIFNPDVCNGCFNRKMLDPSNWFWCPLIPENEKPERQFECTKSITSNMVISEIKKFMKL